VYLSLFLFDRRISLTGRVVLIDSQYTAQHGRANVGLGSQYVQECYVGTAERSLIIPAKLTEQYLLIRLQILPFVSDPVWARYDGAGAHQGWVAWQNGFGTRRVAHESAEALAVVDAETRVGVTRTTEPDRAVLVNGNRGAKWTHPG